MKPMMFGVLYIDLVDRQWKTGRLDRASQLESQCWLMRSLHEVGKLRRRRSHGMVIGMYESSPKVKCREGMCGAFQWIAELQIPSRDRVSISSGARKPRSCVDFAR